jgi:hypothetical protein
MLRIDWVKTHWHWVGLALLSALIAATALVAPSCAQLLDSS